MLQVWNIYLHLPQKWPRFVGKYSSTMEHLGMGKPRYFGSSLHRPRSRLGIGCQLGQTSQLRGPNKSYWGLNGFNLWNVFFFILFPWRMEHDGHTCIYIYILYIYIFTIYIYIYTYQLDSICQGMVKSCPTINQSAFFSWMMEHHAPTFGSRENLQEAPIDFIRPV